MRDHLTFVTKQLTAADSLPALLTATFAGLETAERATTLLTEIAPEEYHATYSTALAQATAGWWALTEAPALIWPSNNRPVADSEHRELAQAIAQLAGGVAQSLLGAAKVTGAADHAACLQAAHHAGRVHHILR
ncbi:hypothetical protein [Actinomadura hibisca]|uniref:hypothetical protein n=1 Tax=Actinomadura hibisca TaxID=68565 RepID=UPI00082A9D48|nr:hypothetical protein [Actinomadura hibisca]